jgi:hypothetical protein
MELTSRLLELRLHRGIRQPFFYRFGAALRNSVSLLGLLLLDTVPHGYHSIDSVTILLAQVLAVPTSSPFLGYCSVVGHRHAM